MGSLVGGVSLALPSEYGEVELKVADEFNTRKSGPFDLGVCGSGRVLEDDRLEYDAPASAGGSMADFVLGLVLVAAVGPFASQDMRLFCFIGSTVSLEFGAMMIEFGDKLD